MRNREKIVLAIIFGFFVSHLTWRFALAAPEDSIESRVREARLLCEYGIHTLKWSITNPKGSQISGWTLTEPVTCFWRSFQVLVGDLSADEDYAKWLSKKSLVVMYQPQKELDAEFLCQRALSIELKRHGEYHESVFESALRLGLIYEHQGRYLDAIKYFERSYLIGRKVFGDSDMRCTESRADTASVLKTMGRLCEAEIIYKQLWSDYQKSPEIGILQGTCNYLPKFYEDTNRLTKAIELNEEILSKKRSLKSNVFLLQQSLLTLSRQLLRVGRVQDSERLGHEAMTIAPRLSDPELAITEPMTSVGLALMLQGRLREAEAYLKQVLGTRRRRLGNDDFRTVGAISNLAALYDYSGRFREAKILASEAVETGTRWKGEYYNKYSLVFKNNLACIYCHSGDYEVAAKMHEEILAVLRRSPGSSNLQTADCLYNLSNDYCHQGRYLEAHVFCSEGLAIFTKVLGRNNCTCKFVQSELKDIAEKARRHPAGNTTEHEI